MKTAAAFVVFLLCILLFTDELPACHRHRKASCSGPMYVVTNDGVLVPMAPSGPILRGWMVDHYKAGSWHYEAFVPAIPSEKARADAKLLEYRNQGLKANLFEIRY